MGSLRKRILSVVTWTSIFALFALHLILNKANQGELVQTVNRVVQIKDNEPKEKVVSIRFESLTSDTEDERSVHDLEAGEKQHEEGYGSRYTNITSDAMFLDTLIESRTPSTPLMMEENKRLKAELGSLTKQIEKLSKSKRQLQELTKRLIAQQDGKEHFPKLDPAVPWVFAVTPTHYRYTQKADLVRLSQTLQHVTNLHWIIVEDSKSSSQIVHNVLVDSGLSFTHLYVATPVTMQRKKGERYNKHHRGVPQRNLALKWIRQNIKPKKTPGVVYFMDDDNTYHKQIFDEVRYDIILKKCYCI